MNKKKKKSYPQSPVTPPPKSPSSPKWNEKDDQIQGEKDRETEEDTTKAAEDLWVNAEYRTKSLPSHRFGECAFLPTLVNSWVQKTRVFTVGVCSPSGRVLKLSETEQQGRGGLVDVRPGLLPSTLLSSPSLVVVFFFFWCERGDQPRRWWWITWKTAACLCLTRSASQLIKSVKYCVTAVRPKIICVQVASSFSCLVAS